MNRESPLALVTGGGGGIGAAVANALASSGWRVAVTGINQGAAEATAARLPGSGHSSWRLDVTDEAAVEDVFGAVIADGGRISGLVCMAGLLLMADGERPNLWDVTLDDWNQTHAVNSRGVFLSCREFARRWLRNPGETGSIVTTSSVAAELGGYRSSASYVASKASVLGLTKLVARELAPLGVTANCVAPGMIDTPLFHSSTPAASTDEEQASSYSRIPLGRIGEPHEIGDMVAFLLSPSARYITGATLDVNGGYYMA